MTANEIVFYHDKKIIITEVYTIVFDSSRTSTTSECSSAW